MTASLNDDDIATVAVYTAAAFRKMWERTGAFRHAGGRPMDYTQQQVLLLYAAIPAMPPDEAGEELGVEASSVRRALTALVKREFLTRHPHPEDRRRGVYMVTPSGHEAITELIARLRPVVNEVLERQGHTTAWRLAARHWDTGKPDDDDVTPG